MIHNSTQSSSRAGNPELIRVLAVDDDPKFGDCLRELFDGVMRFRWVGCYNSPVRFLSELEEIDFDLVLMDIEMPKLKGIDCVGQVKAAKPRAKVLMLTVFEDEDLILKAITEGADGYLLKDSSPLAILNAIEETMRGGAGMSPSVARKIIRNLQDNHKTENLASDRFKDLGLNKREGEILRLLGHGDRYVDIAEKLFISKDTVKTHIRHIYEKLNVHNRTEALNRAGLSKS